MIIDTDHVLAFKRWCIREGISKRQCWYLIKKGRIRSVKIDCFVFIFSDQYYRRSGHGHKAAVVGSPQERFPEGACSVWPRNKKPPAFLGAGGTNE